MARKKAERTKAGKIKANTQEVPRGPCIEGELLWKYRAVDAELRNVELHRRHVEAEIDNVIGVVGDLRLQKLWQMFKTAKTDLANRQAAVKEVNGQIEDVLGISLRNAAINDETGEVFILDTENKNMDNKVITDKGDKT